MVAIGARVLIIEDCREGGIVTGQTGIYEGEFRVEGLSFPNPRIRLQDGSVVWGCECWWKPVSEAGALIHEQKALREHKLIYRRLWHRFAGTRSKEM